MKRTSFRFLSSLSITTWCLFLLFALQLSCFVLSASASPWSLTSADFKSQQVDVIGLSTQGVSLATPSGPQKLPLSSFLSISRDVASPATQPAPFTVLLSSGDRLTGTPASLTGETLGWGSPAVGALSFPLKQVRAVVRSGVAVGQAENPPAEDTLTLANGDVVKGIVSGLQDNKILVAQQGGDTLPVPLESLQSLVFASTAQPAASAPSRGFRVTLSDGSSLQAPDVALDKDHLILRLPGSPERTLPASAVVSIEQVNGPVTFLPSLTPVEDIQKPFLGDPWPTRVNKTVTGQPIRIGSEDYKGLGVHSYSRLTYKLDPSYATFRTQYAVDGNGPYANVTVRILLDEKVAYEKKNVVAGPPSGVVTLPLGGAKTLTLEVDYGLSNDTQDRFLWLNPALLRNQ